MGQTHSRELLTIDGKSQQKMNILIKANMKPSENISYARKQSRYEAELIRCNSQLGLPEELEQLLFNRTYFDRDELQLLFREFKKWSHSNPGITKTDFGNIFPVFRSSGCDAFLDSLFLAIDSLNKDNTGIVNFSEYICFLSIISRGSKQEKLELAFHICDLDNDGIITKNDVLEVFNLANRVFATPTAQAQEESCTPDVIDSIFSGDAAGLRENKQGNFQVSLQDFVRIAERDPDLYRCFGMFDYIYDIAVRPIESEVCSDMTKPDMQGHLVKRKQHRVLGGIINNMQRRYIVIKNGFFIEFRHLRSTPKRVICLLNARVKAFDHVPGHLWNKTVRSNGFLLSVGNYTRIFFTHTPSQAQEWVHAIRANAKGGYRYNSFAPVRDNISANYYVNGVEYYTALANAIPNATRQIFIAGWWVAPELYLIRTQPLQLKYRLDNMLAERAANGVQVCVLVWDETSLGIALGSSHTKSWLEGLNAKHIRVVKHPKSYPLTWSHHQKTVVIDQELAFVGGQDLCFMRYDDNDYTLLDFNSVKFPGKDYGNLNTFVKRTGDPMIDQIDRKTIPRLPWHDVTVSVRGAAAADVAFNFIQRWNHSIESNGVDNKYPYLLPKDLEDDKCKMKESVWQHLANLVRHPTHPTTHPSSDLRHSAHSMKRPSQPNVRRNSQWKKSAPLDGFVKMDKRFSLPNLLTMKNSTEKSSSSSISKQYYRGLGNVPYTEVDDDVEMVATQRCCEVLDGTCAVQIVRSVCEWSAGQETEDSCYKAYMDLIANAQHFIYIQNLYFISSTGADKPKNRIALAIVRRIRRAILYKEKFRVIVLLSVYPAGPIAQVTTKMIIGWCMKTICRGENSIFGMLQAQFPDVDISEYISFYALRNWAYADNRLFTEEIYVHSKVMIVDDRVAIVGSANINDRSMRGTRDSEICAIVSDVEQVDSTMWGIPFKASQFAHQLRKKLWSAHLGISTEAGSMLNDPIHPFTFYNVWRATAADNTTLYSEVFGDALPENHIKLANIQRSIPLTSQAQLEKLRKIRGYLICFPERFFIDEAVEPTVFNKEFFLNTNIFI